MSITTDPSQLSSYATSERAPAAISAGRYERTAAAAGFAFVGLGVVSSFLPGAPPASDASTTKIAAYFHDHGTAIKAQQLVGGLGLVALIWWFGAVWRMLSRAEGERPRLTAVAAAGLAFGIPLAMVSGVVTATAAIRSDSPELTHVLYSLGLVAVAAAGFGIGTFLLATNLLTWRARLTPRWISGVGVLAGVAFLVGTGATVSDGAAINTLALIAFFIWCVWIVAFSVVMWRTAAS